MRSPELRVKIKSLAAESLIIKREMLRFRTTDPYRERLHLHRVHDGRDEQRATLVAYGFLNGLYYWQIEESAYKEPKWDRVAAMVKKYGTEGTAEERVAALQEWRKTYRDNRGMYRAEVLSTMTEAELTAGLEALVNEVLTDKA
jgi:hypothetical protein